MARRPNQNLTFIHSTNMQEGGTSVKPFTQFSLVNAHLLKHLVNSCLSTSCVPGLVPGTGRTEQAKSLVQGRHRSSEAAAMDAVTNRAGGGLNREGWKAGEMQDRTYKKGHQGRPFE